MRPLFSLLALSSGARAAILSPAGALIERQDITSSSKFTYSTIGYSSAYMQGETTVWAPNTFDGDYYFTITSGDFFQLCSWSYSYMSIGTSSYSYSTISTSCPIYTSCSLGVMLAASTTYQCAGDGYMCATNLLYDSWGAPDATTALGCYYSTSVQNSTIRSMFRTKPADVLPSTVPPSVTTSSSTQSSTASPAPTPSTPAPSETAAPKSGGGGGGSNNTGVIAGSTVGGIAVLGAIGVAVLYILKRSKKHQAVPGHEVPVYQPDKPPEVYQHYDPHQSVLYSQGTGSPHTYSPAPIYPEGYTRGELPGVTSPPPQQAAGSPNLGMPPPSGYH